MPQTGRRTGVKEYLNDHGYSVAEAVSEMAAARGTTPAAVALAWLLSKPAVASPIIGANSPAQLADLLPAAELELSGAEIEALDAVSATS
jgi:aryl-alcohol dehydrogenase-like predicted oxidoreductase